MPLALVVATILAQKTPAETLALRKYRYGLSAARIEAMGEDAYDAFYRKRTPDADVGFMRGVSQGVYTDAYRENTERLYRRSLLPAERYRLLSLDKQMRFLGVLFARNEWTFSGGNGFDPESDDLTYAQAERRLYTFRSVVPDPARTKARLAAYRTAIRARARKDKLYGAQDQTEGRTRIEANLAKIDRALKKAAGLCRTPAERAVLLDFVANEASTS